MSLDRRYSATVHADVAAVAPIKGIRFVDIDDPSTWVIDFASEATPEERTAAQAVIDAIDVGSLQTPMEIVAAWIQANPPVANVLKMSPDEIEATVGAYDFAQMREVVVAQAVLLSYIARWIIRQ